MCRNASLARGKSLVGKSLAASSCPPGPLAEQLCCGGELEDDAATASVESGSSAPPKRLAPTAASSCGCGCGVVGSPALLPNLGAHFMLDPQPVSHEPQDVGVQLQAEPLDGAPPPRSRTKAFAVEESVCGVCGVPAVDVELL
mmetsp:Transcript_13872/g.23003  ORF Transcript_13872/g.23003 Transcript_13872/m.23003 type:complete len:143 (-) Transcript_13872:1971-2399(-)